MNIDLLAKLVDFDQNYFSPHDIIDEFNHKYGNSFLNVDGVPFHIKRASIQEDEDHEDDNDYVLLETYMGDNIRQVLEIAPIHPPTGLYASKRGLLYLYRIPQRQWIKSFSPNRNYGVNTLLGDPTVMNTVLVRNPKYAKESIIHDNKVFLHWKYVADLSNGMITMKNKHFTKEIKELWPQYRILLAADPLPGQQDADLQLDF